MTLPLLAGEIERRILVNYRVDPAAVGRVLPAPFRPQTIHGYAVAGICLIRLGSMRPRFLPAWAGLRSENAAHRIAVEWDTPAGTKTGVYSGLPPLWRPNGHADLLREAVDGLTGE